MKSILESIVGLTRKGERFVLATVISRNGSAPRSTGARMLVREDGTIAGTVGGGVLEASVIQLAKEVFRSRGAVVESFRFSGEDASTMDAICGGQVEVLVEWIDGTDPDWKTVLEKVQAASARHQKAWLLTGLPGEEPPGQDRPDGPLAHAVLRRDGDFTGRLPREIEVEKVFGTTQPQLLSIAGGRWLLEPLETGGAVYIFGAGHVGRSLAAFTRAVGFWTVVLDDRAEYANCQNIPAADEVVVLASFDDALQGLSIQRDHFIVIVTRGHLNDRTVLAQALRTPAGYIGMIGSRRKCGLVFEELRKMGYGETDFQRVHAPIGLPIRAETPEEIGISITAEMIRTRAELSGG